MLPDHCVQQNRAAAPKPPEAVVCVLADQQNHHACAMPMRCLADHVQLQANDEVHDRGMAVRGPPVTAGLVAARLASRVSMSVCTGGRETRCRVDSVERRKALGREATVTGVKNAQDLSSGSGS